MSSGAPRAARGEFPSRIRSDEVRARGVADIVNGDVLGGFNAEAAGSRTNRPGCLIGGTAAAGPSVRLGPRRSLSEYTRPSAITRRMGTSVPESGAGASQWSGSRRICGFSHVISDALEKAIDRVGCAGARSGERNGRSASRRKRRSPHQHRRRALPDEQVQTE